MRFLLQEPLVHLAVVSALLAWFEPTLFPPLEMGYEIEVPAGVADVPAYIDEEILVREAIALRVYVQAPTVRQALIDQVLKQEQSAAKAEPLAARLMSLRANYEIVVKP